MKKQSDRSVQSVSDLATILDQLPPKPAPFEYMSAKQITAELKSEIASARAKHYSWEEIREILQDATGKTFSA